MLDRAVLLAMTGTQLELILVKKNKLLAYVTKLMKGQGYCWIKDSYTLFLQLSLSPLFSFSPPEVSASLSLILFSLLLAFSM